MMGHKNEKSTGQDGISCDRAQELFYNLAACELNSEDMRILSLHEASCPSCSLEFREWSSLRIALQGSRIAPATDFKAGVMERIRETRLEPATRPSVFWGMVHHNGWARSLATVAVVLIMLTGAAKLPAVGSLIAQLGKQPVTVAFKQTGRQVAVQPTQQPVTEPHPTSPATASNNAPAPSTGAPSVAQPQVKSVTTVGDKIVQSSSASLVPDKQYTFDNKPSVVITTTTIKIAVGDLDQARSTALSIANNFGASQTSEQSAQDGNSNLLLIHFTVDPGKASTFLSSLSSLGGVVGEDKAVKDVTDDYGRTLNAYQDLLAQQATAADSDKDQYTSQIAILKNELQNWKDASENQVVMLWLIQ
jgi:Sec-independent protein translocase protein TatA